MADDLPELIKFSDLKDEHPLTLDGDDTLIAVAHPNPSSETGYSSLTTTPTQLAQFAVEEQTFANLKTSQKTVENSINQVVSNLAPDYDATSTYAVDDCVLYEGNLYQANQDISTAEDWTPAHWTQIKAVDVGSGGSGGHTIVDGEGTSLTQRTNLQFNGAYLEDNSTDDTTEVNVAREMTYAEFELLSNDEKQGIINVTDITSGTEDKFQPVIYSEDEREIGVWTDGKPLYETTVKIQSLPSSATSVDYPHNISNIDTICTSWGYLRWASGNITPLNTMQFSGSSTVSVGASFFYYVTKTDVSISVGMDRSSTSATVIIRYTKTTDTAGSGQWTPQGVPAHHYSTNEQIVGTWIDGSTLYEKTVDIGSLPDTTEKLVPHNITNLLYVVSITGVAKNSSGNQLPLPYADIIDAYEVNISADNTNININTGRDRTSFSGYVTVRYIKSSS